MQPILTIGPAATRAGVREASLIEAADRGTVPVQWTESPTGQRIRVFAVADIEAYRQRRADRLKAELDRIEGAA
jgi:hypothetical protein